MTGPALDLPTAAGTTVAPATVDVEALPLHRFIGARLLDPQHPEVGLTFTVHPGIEGRAGRLNFGAVSVIIDAAAYLALSPSLSAGEDAVSHDIHESVLRPVLSGQVVEVRGRLVQRGRRVAFVDVEASVEGQLIATARITKTIVEAPPAEG